MGVIMEDKPGVKQLKFSGYALRQMFARKISDDDVRTVIQYGVVITHNPDDTPFPSALMLGFVDNQPLHVVIGYDTENETGYVITAYYPDPGLWSKDFKMRTKR